MDIARWTLTYVFGLVHGSLEKIWQESGLQYSLQHHIWEWRGVRWPEWWLLQLTRVYKYDDTPHAALTADLDEVPISRLLIGPQPAILPSHWSIKATRSYQKSLHLNNINC